MSARKFIREIERRAGVQIAKVSRTGGGHLRLCLGCGRAIFTSATPSDHRTILNVVGEIRRALNYQPVQGGQQQ